MAGPDTSLVDLDTLLKLLAEPNRLRILVLLATFPCCVGEIQQHLGLGQANTSRHLERLREAELVHTRRQGSFMYYHINGQVLGQYEFLTALLTEAALKEPYRDDLARLLAWREQGADCRDLPGCAVL